MAAPLDLLLRRLARRRTWERLAQGLGPVIALSAMVGAIIVAVIRLTTVEGGWTVPALAAAAVLAPLALVPRLLARQEPPGRLAGTLDQLAHADGLVMALAEIPAPARDAHWLTRAETALAQVRLPRPDLRPLAGAALGILCLGGAAALPQAEPPPFASVAADPARPLRQEAGELAQTQVLTPEEQRAVDQQLSALTAQGLDQAAWQGLDQVAQRLEEQAKAAGERLAAALEAAQNAASTGSGDAQAQAAALGQALAELAATAPGLLPALPPGASQQAVAQALAEAARQGRISPAQAEALAKAGLKPGQPNGPKLSPSECRALGRDVQRALDNKRQGLGKSRAASALQNFLAGRKPGAAGVSRDQPGQTPITRISRDALAGGQSQALAQGLVENPDGSVTVATQTRDPEVAARSLERAAAQAFDPTAADSRRASVAPRHRAAVAAFFAADAVPVPAPVAPRTAILPAPTSDIP